MQQDARYLKLHVHGNKAGKLLAHLTKESFKPIMIPNVLDVLGNLQTDPVTNCILFRDYYEHLYSHPRLT